MICPVCGLDTPERQPHCIGCAADLSLLQESAAAVRELDSQRAELSALLERMARARQQVDGLRQRVHDALAGGSGAGRAASAGTPAAGAALSAQAEGATAGAAAATPRAQRPPTFLATLFARSAAHLRWLVLGARPGGRFNLELRLGQHWMLIVGILVLLVGVAYFLKYSFDRNWITPLARVIQSGVLGLAALAGGEYFRTRLLSTFGLYLMGAGIAVWYASVFAAFQLYELLPQGAAFALMVAVTAVAGFLALRHGAQGLAVLGLLGGFATPALLSTGSANLIGLMTYLVILNAGILGIAFYARWELLNYLGFVSTWVMFQVWFGAHFTPYGEDAYSQGVWTLLFVQAFFLIYTLVPYVYFLIRTGGAKTGWSLSIVLMNPYFAFYYSQQVVDALAGGRWTALVSAAYAVVFFALAWQLFFRRADARSLFVLPFANACLFAALTVPLLLSGAWITVFWAVQSLAVAWAAVRLGSSRVMAVGMVLLALAAARFALVDYASVLLRFAIRPVGTLDASDYTRGLAERLVAAAALIVTLGLTVRSLHRDAAAFPRVLRERLGPWLQFLNGLLLGLLFYVLSVEVHGFFKCIYPPARLAALSVLWALFSAGMVALGFVRNDLMVRRVAIGLFLVTLVKVVLLDMANVDTPFRIISFIVLGALLIGTSFLYYRFAERIPQADRAGNKA